MKGKLYLVPVTLGSKDFKQVIPESVLNIIRELRYFIVEDIRSARRFLRLIDPDFRINDSEFVHLNEHTPPEEHSNMISGLLDGMDAGLMSEAGVPGVADPGAPVVGLAHRNNIRVVPLTGPSSILLALMASGLNGQNFSFNGYLPVKRNERLSRLRELERLSGNGYSQIFMETPYRNQKMLEDIMEACNPATHLCLAVNISMDSEIIKTRTVKDWKANMPDINKQPAIFIIGQNI